MRASLPPTPYLAQKLPGSEDTWLSYAVDRKTNALETRNNTWLFTYTPLKKGEWKFQL